MIRTSYALINLIKAMCGVGVFALPVAFQTAGLWMGVVLALALGVVNAHSMMKLVKCSQHLSEKKQLSKDFNKSAVNTVSVTTSSDKAPRTASDTSAGESVSQASQSGLASGKKEEAEEKRVPLNYGNMAEEAFASRETKWLRKLAKPTKFAVNLCVIGLQLGMCSAFYIFVEDHVRQIINYLLDKELSRDMTFFAILPFFILIATVRSLVVLSWIGFVGNILVVIALAIIVIQMLFMKHVPMSHLPAVTSIEGVTLAAGSMIYAYSAQGVVLPLENKMRKPQDMLGFFGVISISVAFICTVYVVVGFLGYLTYGDDLKGSITLNLDNSPLDFSVKIMLLLMTYCGYLIQHYPIVEMLLPYVQRRFSGANKCRNLMLDYALRYAVVVMSLALAYAIPNFDEIIPFVGITTGMMLALFFPPLLETVVFLERWRRSSTVILIYNITHNILYIILGVLFVVVGVYSNYKVLSDPNNHHRE
ncbi:hypothetical protein Aduo_004622 [Ancylostoma duodenale]